MQLRQLLGVTNVGLTIGPRASIAIVVAVAAVRRVWVIVGAAAVTKWPTKQAEVAMESSFAKGPAGRVASREVGSAGVASTEVTGAATEVTGPATARSAAATPAMGKG